MKILCPITNDLIRFLQGKKKTLKPATKKWIKFFDYENKLTFDDIFWFVYGDYSIYNSISYLNQQMNIWCNTPYLKELFANVINKVRTIQSVRLTLNYKAFEIIYDKHEYHHYKGLSSRVIALDIQGAVQAWRRQVGHDKPWMLYKIKKIKDRGKPLIVVRSDQINSKLFEVLTKKDLTDSDLVI